MAEEVKVLVEGHHILEESSNEAKRAHLEFKEKRQLQCEWLCQEGAKHQHQHKLKILEQQLLLACIKAGLASPDTEGEGFALAGGGLSGSLGNHNVGFYGSSSSFLLGQEFNFSA